MVTWRYSKGVVLFLILLLFWGCTSGDLFERKYMGKTIPIEYFNMMADSGKYIQTDENLSFSYSYDLDREAGLIHLEGIAKYIKSIDDSKYHSETILLNVQMFEVIVFFGDETGKIMGVETFFLNKERNIFDPIPFKVSLPLKKDYKGMRITYHMELLGV